MVALAAFFLTGCDDPAPKEQSSTSVKPPSQDFTIATRSWLDHTDKVSPAVWLASREAGRDLEPNDPAARSLRTLLEDADIRFTETPRMIANRAVQVQSMLAEHGVAESPRDVIAALVSIAPVGERAAFGETCQHYVIARSASRTQVAALDVLRRQPLPTAKPGDEE